MLEGVRSAWESSTPVVAAVVTVAHSAYFISFVHWGYFHGQACEGNFKNQAMLSSSLEKNKSEKTITVIYGVLLVLTLDISFF